MSSFVLGAEKALIRMALNILQHKIKLLLCFIPGLQGLRECRDFQSMGLAVLKR